MRNSLRAGQNSCHSAFTLIELLVVIAIIAILASILFPVFARAREKARAATCQSNCKQFMLGILQYAQDYDESMPLCVRTQDGVGPVTAAQVGAQQTGVHIALMPYIKSTQVFQCPDDNGFIAGTGGPKAYNTSIPASTRVWEAYGSSYKFNQDNFSVSPSTTPSTFSPTQPKVSTLGDKSSGGTYDKALYPASGGTRGAGTQAPPFPMTLAFFARPSETAVLHDYVNPWKAPDPTKADCAAIMHDQVAIYAFADGHVKALLSKAQEDSYCDGPTYSPIRNAGQPNYTPQGDGSCNTGGMERNKS